MKFSKQQKPFVIEWIDRQFATDQLFPCDCCAIVDGQPRLCSTHVKAYKAWNKTPHKRSHIREWIDDWLSSAEKDALKTALRQRENDEEPFAEEEVVS